MNPTEEISRGVLASQILDNPIYAEAMTAVKADLFSQWASTSWHQYRKRQELWRMYRAAEGIEARIAKVMSTGRLGRATLDNKERLKRVK